MGSLERQLSARGFCDTQAGTLALERGEKETLLKSNSAAGVGMNVQMDEEDIIERGPLKLGGTCICSWLAFTINPPISDRLQGYNFTRTTTGDHSYHATSAWYVVLQRTIDLLISNIIQPEKESGTTLLLLLTRGRERQQIAISRHVNGACFCRSVIVTRNTKS